MAKWETFDPTGAYPDGLASILEDASSLADTLGTALDAAATVVEIAAGFVTGMKDVNAGTIAAMQEAIVSAIQQLTQTGSYWLFHSPASFAGTLPPHKWLSQISNSLDDRMDEERPILVDPNAYVSVVAVCATSENYRDMYKLYEDMFEMFGVRVPSSAQADAWPNPGDTFTVVPGVGQAPNWGSKRLADVIPPLGEMADYLASFLTMISAAKEAGSIYQDFADQLRDKAEALNAFATEVQDLLDAFTNILNFEGAYVLSFTGQGDSEWVQQQLLASTGGPLDDTEAEYSAGAVFLVTGGTAADVAPLAALFGL